MMRLCVGLICLLCALTATDAPARSRAHSGGGKAPGRFDYYVMALSWSPSYCATHPQETPQCARRGFGFVMHGLWPQYRNGEWPQHCVNRSAPDDATRERALAFMPSPNLVEHEWQTHGTCSGLDARAYFDLADRAFASIAIPAALAASEHPPALSAAEVERAFLAANPALHADSIGVFCHNGYELSEVRICLNRDTLAPQTCTGPVHNTCRYGTLKIPASRALHDG